MADPLVDNLTALLDRAASGARTEDARLRLVDARDRLAGPLRLAIAGKVKAGKSTLLNAILGDELAPTDAGECTKIVTWYREGTTPQVTVFPQERDEGVIRPWSRESGALEVDLGELEAGEVDRIEVDWPTSKLRELTILDTPGIASISADISARTQRVLAADDGRVPVADAVLYLMRHTHASDVRFLESFHDDELAHGTPMNSVGVLSRADEIGACRLDAMETADRIARRYEADPRLRRLCPVIVPVNGLLAFAATTLREVEYAMLATLARSERSEVEQLLLTADRFLHRSSGVLLTEIEREHLMDRMGLFGVRMSVELIRAGYVTSAIELSDELIQRSGLDRLRSVLTRQFEQRSRVLKARSAMAVLADVLRNDGCADRDALQTAAEQLSASTHEFEEVRLLSALRSGSIEVRPERIDELDRLLGGSGHSASARLGLPDDATGEEIRASALDSLLTWQRLAEHPLSSRQLKMAARAATRTLEGLVAAYTPVPS
ncbi:dynamin family protein [Microlunatus ginsengisoli]|uniref:50S ribosome-binding GTPase n=1 Tax=Microlunatus ginsengisoli TaxID=363863 RepID=A0ABP7ARJ4_9ACTN